MKTFQVTVQNLAYLTLYESIVEQLPSLSEEARSEKTKELGQEPLCKENVNDRLFMLGMRVFVDKEVPLFSAVKKSEEVNLYTKVIRILVDLHTIATAKFEAAKKIHKPGTPEYTSASNFLDIVSIIVAHIDAEVTGDDSLKRVITQSAEAAAAAKKKPKPKKKGTRR